MASAMPSWWSEWFTDAGTGRRYRTWRENERIVLFQWDREDGPCTDARGTLVTSDSPSEIRDAMYRALASSAEVSHFLPFYELSPRDDRRRSLHQSTPQAPSYSCLPGFSSVLNKEMGKTIETQLSSATKGNTVGDLEAKANRSRAFSPSLESDTARTSPVRSKVESLMSTSIKDQPPPGPVQEEPAKYESRAQSSFDYGAQVPSLSYHEESGLAAREFSSRKVQSQLSAGFLESRGDEYQTDHTTTHHEDHAKSSDKGQPTAIRNLTEDDFQNISLPKTPFNETGMSMKMDHSALRRSVSQSSSSSGESRCDELPRLKRALPQKPATLQHLQEQRKQPEQLEREEHMRHRRPKGPGIHAFVSNFLHPQVQRQRQTDYRSERLRKGFRCRVASPSQSSEMSRPESEIPVKSSITFSGLRYHQFGDASSQMESEVSNAKFVAEGSSTTKLPSPSASTMVPKDTILDETRYQESTKSEPNRNLNSATSDTVSALEDSDEIEYSGLVSEFVNELSKVIVSSCLKSIIRPKVHTIPDGHETRIDFRMACLPRHDASSSRKQKRNMYVMRLSATDFRAQHHTHGHSETEELRNANRFFEQGGHDPSHGGQYGTVERVTLKRLSDRNSSSPPDSDDEKGEGRASARKRPKLTKKLRLFACPYYKYDPVRYSAQNTEENAYRGCAVKKLANISRLKQHLYRVHKRPEQYCARCYEVFQSQREKDTHARLNHCSTAEEKFDEKMDQDKVNTIKRRKQGADPVQSWFSIYGILFPGKEPPLSPYNHFGDTDAIEHFVGVFRTLGPDLARDLYSNLVRTHVGAQPLAISTQDIVDEAFEIALPQYLEIIEQRRRSGDLQTSNISNDDEDVGAGQIAADTSTYREVTDVRNSTSSNSDVPGCQQTQIEPFDATNLGWQPTNGFNHNVASWPPRDNDDYLNPVFPWFEDAFGQYNSNLLDYYPIVGTELGTEVEEIGGY